MGEPFTFENVVINFPRVIEPVTTQRDPNLKFRNVVLIDQADPVQMQQLNEFKALINRVGQANGAVLYPEISPGQHDSQNLYINMTSQANRPPSIFDIGNHQIQDPSVIMREIYGGAICNVACDIYFSSRYKRVCIGFLGLQKMKDGPRLDNAPDMSNWFQPQQGQGFGNQQNPNQQQWNPQQQTVPPQNQQQWNPQQQTVPPQNQQQWNPQQQTVPPQNQQQWNPQQQTAPPQNQQPNNQQSGGGWTPGNQGDDVPF